MAPRMVERDSAIWKVILSVCDHKFPGLLVDMVAVVCPETGNLTRECLANKVRDKTRRGIVTHIHDSLRRKDVER